MQAALASIDARVCVLDAGGIHRYVNERAAQGFERTRAEVIGRSLSEMGMPPPLVATLEESLARLFETGVDQRGELTLRGRTLGYTQTPLRDPEGRITHAVFISRDVTEENAAHFHCEILAELGDALASSLDYESMPQELTRRAVPRIADWALVDLLGPEGKLVRVAAAHGDPGRLRQSYENYARYPPETMPEFAQMEVLRSGAPRLIENFGRAALGDLLPPGLMTELEALGLCSSLIVPLSARGRPLGTLTLLMAESERHFTAFDVGFAVELGRRAGVAADNAQLYRQAHDASRLKDEFLAVLSHELRTPLTAIVGWASLLQTGRLNEEKRRRAVETIARNAEVQRQLVDDLLDVSRIISGKLRLELAPLALNPTVEEALDSVRPTADAKGVRLRVALAPEGVDVRGDADRLQQIAWNLLTNAIKFTPTGGLVEVTLSREGDSAALTVEDTGRGIEQSFLKHLFEPFRQADTSTTRAQGGLGLGLSITRHLVEAHGGTLEAQSEGVGHGARFTVRLPLLPGAAPAESAPALAPLVKEALPDLAGVNILLVEDAEDTRDLISHLLERSAATIRTASNAQDAWSLFRTARPDVLISDLGLPGHDGRELVGWMRALPESEGGTLPAIALTGRVRPEDREQALQAGFTAFLKKPVDLGELVELVAQLAGRARG